MIQPIANLSDPRIVAQEPMIASGMCILKWVFTDGEFMRHVTHTDISGKPPHRVYYNERTGQWQDTGFEAKIVDAFNVAIKEENAKSG
jgi:hypothetical protein